MDYLCELVSEFLSPTQFHLEVIENVEVYCLPPLLYITYHNKCC